MKWWQCGGSSVRLKCRFLNSFASLPCPHFRSGFSHCDHLSRSMCDAHSPYIVGRGKRGEWIPSFFTSVFNWSRWYVYCLVWNLINTACWSKRYSVCLTGIDLKRSTENKKKIKKNLERLMHMKGKHIL